MNSTDPAPSDDAPLLLSSRWVYRTLREVHLEQGRIVVKRFTHHPGRRDRRAVWAWEDSALRRLTGLPVPQTYGFQCEKSGEGESYVLRKEYIAGTPLTRITPTDAAEMGRLLARIHERRVVTGDPSHANFIRTPAGPLYFIDFGRARTFSWKTPFFFFYVGKDLARCHRTGVARDPELWTCLLSEYFQTSAPGAFARILIEFGFWYWRTLWRKRGLS